MVNKGYKGYKGYIIGPNEHDSDGNSQYFLEGAKEMIISVLVSLTKGLYTGIILLVTLK
jgi:hypothetical protein